MRKAFKFRMFTNANQERELDIAFFRCLRSHSLLIIGGRARNINHATDMVNGEIMLNGRVAI